MSDFPQSASSILTGFHRNGISRVGGISFPETHHSPPNCALPRGIRPRKGEIFPPRRGGERGEMRGEMKGKMTVNMPDFSNSPLRARLRRPKSARTESHRADFDRAERADAHCNRGHPSASMGSPGHTPPMSRATREVNRPSSTSMAHLPLALARSLQATERARISNRRSRQRRFSKRTSGWLRSRRRSRGSRARQCHSGATRTRRHDSLRRSTPLLRLQSPRGVRGIPRVRALNHRQKLPVGAMRSCSVARVPSAIRRVAAVCTTTRWMVVCAML